ncbi:hypothetical protein WKK05_18320 [Nostoc sp. UHCC 0302]
MEEELKNVFNISSNSPPAYPKRIEWGLIPQIRIEVILSTDWYKQ